MDSISHELTPSLTDPYKSGDIDCLYESHHRKELILLLTVLTVNTFHELLTVIDLVSKIRCGKAVDSLPGSGVNLLQQI